MKVFFLHLIILILFLSCHTYNNESSIKLLPKFKMLLTDSITYFESKAVPEDKPIILFYFGAYCDHSRKMMNRILEQNDYFKDINLYLMTNDPYEDLISFYKNYHLEKYNNIKIGIDYDHVFQKEYKINHYPYLVLYDKNKKLIQTFPSEVYTREIKKYLSQAK